MFNIGSSVHRLETEPGKRSRGSREQEGLIARHLQAQRTEEKMKQGRKHQNLVIGKLGLMSRCNLCSC